MTKIERITEQSIANGLISVINKLKSTSKADIERLRPEIDRLAGIAKHETSREMKQFESEVASELQKS